MIISVAHTGQEANNLDFESKAFHAGRVDQVGMEVADNAQISKFNFPKAEPELQGIDGKGPPDLAMFVGMPYYMESLILSGLKHFAPNLKTMTVDNVYHPHASWSFPNTMSEDWADNLKLVTAKF